VLKKRLTLVVLLAALLACPTPQVWADTANPETILSLAPGNRPEGIAVHQTGDVFVGNRQVGGTVTSNEILKITPDGNTAMFAALPDTNASAEGLLGLTVDRVGRVYAALVSLDGNHGIWRVSRDGTRAQLLPGSSDIAFPNALTFDPAGNLYVTDSFDGAIWRARPGKAFIRWVADEFLEPLPFDPFGDPLPGANGIAFFPPDILYVANTEQGLIARVRIDPDGSAGTVEALTPAFAVPVVDGIAVDAHGQIYGVLPAFSVLQTSPLVRIDPDTGAVTAIVAEVVGASAFDKPLSLTFAGGRWGVKAVFVTNGDLPVFPGGPGPGVVKVDIGVPGFPVR
jgi:sugar lactone lactonase YvrE